MAWVAVKKKSMYTAVNNIKWSNVLNKVNKRNQSLFIWGMAVHIATDLYAHSAVGRFPGKWVHLDHDKRYNSYPKNGYADSTYYFGERYDVAKEVAKKSIKKFVSGNCGNVNDFNPSYGFPNGGITWKIINLYENVSVHSKNVANTLKFLSYTKK